MILDQAGLFYPIFRCDQAQPQRLNINNHSVPLRCLYDENPENYHINKRWKVENIKRAIQRYTVQFEQALESDHSLVLSGEGLSLLTADALARLVGVIENHGFQIKPMILVRSPLDYAHSIAQQLVRGGQYVSLVGLGSLRAPCLPQHLTIPDGLNEIRTLQKVFDERLIAVPFRHACRHRCGPVGYLLEEFCGLSSLDSIAFKQTQESKSNLWVRLQNQVNERWPRFNRNKRLNDDHFRIQEHYSQSGVFRLTQYEVDLLADQLVQSNQALADLLGSEFIEASEEVSGEISDRMLLDLLTEQLFLDQSRRA